jgi:hypothetical protein
MLVTMKNSALIDQLVSIAGGNIDLVNEADLKEVVDYIMARRAREPAAA